MVQKGRLDLKRATPSARIFCRAAGYKHRSRRLGARILAELLSAEGWNTLLTEDPRKLVAGAAGQRTVFVFLNTSGSILTPDARTALQNAVASGAGFAGIHSAADTEHEWEWYGQLLGTRFGSHPLMQHARVCRTEEEHPSTAHLPLAFQHREEWYNFTQQPSPTMRILLTVDESTYRGGRMGTLHPICWCSETGPGRMWYTALGHRSTTFSEEWFQRHCIGGIRWAVGE